MLIYIYHIYCTLPFPQAILNPTAVLAACWWSVVVLKHKGVELVGVKTQGGGAGWC